MSRRGAPTVVTLGVLTFTYASIELLRDRKSGGPPWSGLKASREYERQLQKCSERGRFVTANTAYQYWKRFQTLARRQNSREMFAAAEALIKLGQDRRKDLGWDSSFWLWLIRPEDWPGYEITTNQFQRAFHQGEMLIRDQTITLQRQVIDKP